MTQGRKQPNSTSAREADAEDFLFHLYRGSESLAEGRFDGAREHFEQALKRQPRDPQAQDLLAKLYFRLGVYPRAIELYLDLVRQLPEETAPRVNLALALLKTGQMRDTVTHLLPVIEREPNHQRAWAYLGLAWSRLNEFAKAREAFTRAGHEGMARRMQLALEQEYESAHSPTHTGDFASATTTAERAIDAITAASLEAAPRPVTSPLPDATDGAELPDAPLGTLLSLEPRMVPPTEPLELVAGALLARAGSAARWSESSVRVGGNGEHLPVFESVQLERPLLWVARGWVVLPPVRGITRTLLAVHDPGVMLRAELVLAFDGGLQHRLHATNERTGEHWLELRGQGLAALQYTGTLTALALGDGESCELPHGTLAGFDDSMTKPEMRAGGTQLRLRGPGLVWLLLDKGD